MSPPYPHNPAGSAWAHPGAFQPLPAPVVHPWAYRAVHTGQGGQPDRRWTTAPATLKVARRANSLLRRRRKPAPVSTTSRTTQLVAALGGGVTAYVLVRVLLGRFAHPYRSRT